MKYCIDFKKNFKYINEVDEITIEYNRKDTSLLEFLLLYKDKRVNIYITDAKDFLENNDLDRFIAISKDYPNLNYYLKLRNPAYNEDAFHLYEKIREETNILYFFDTLVSDWDTLWGYIEMLPLDIYITEDLCFELDKVSSILHKYGIKVRTFPNVCQTKWNKTPSLKTFFIRPEDVDIYEKYIDTLEFFGRSDSIETMYKVYAIDKKWFGPLKELIIGFKSDMDSRFIIPRFAEKRIRCGKKCLKGGTCNVCSKIEQLSKVLKENNLLVQIDKE